MSAPVPTVFVVDDDPSVRSALARLIRSVGLQVETFSSTQEYKERPPFEGPGCVVLDVRMPGASGLDLQTEIVERGGPPIVFITGHGSVAQSVRAMKAGAVDFLEKPFEEEELLSAVHRAIDRGIQARENQNQRREVERRIAFLTERERQVFELVVSGRMNKQIASSLGISEKTVKVHRARVMEKMQAGSLADLVRMAEKVLKPRQSP
jgi:RNA polymerase sigma factor (sigma-70 family)